MASVGCSSLKFYGFTCVMIHIMTFSKSLNVHLLLQKKPALFSEALKMPSDLIEPGREAVPSTQSLQSLSPCSAGASCPMHSPSGRTHLPYSCAPWLQLRETFIRKATRDGEDESHVDLVLSPRHLRSVCLFFLTNTLSWRSYFMPALSYVFQAKQSSGESWLNQSGLQVSHGVG